MPYTNLLSYFNVHHSKTEVFLFKSISEWTNRNPFFGSHASAINHEIKKFLIQVRISTDKRNLSPTQNWDDMFLSYRSHSLTSFSESGNRERIITWRNIRKRLSKFMSWFTLLTYVSQYFFFALKINVFVSLTEFL